MVGTSIECDAERARIVIPTMAQWGAIISQVAKERGITCICGRPIEPGRFDSYDHDGGLPVKYSKERQWVYHHCACGYDYSFQHILPRDYTLQSIEE